MDAPARRIFGRCSFDNFVGREEELHRLIGIARQAGTTGPLALLAEPGAGSSELLRQTYDLLFGEQNGIAPVYFEIKQSDLTAARAARRFLRAFLLQITAFRRRDHFLLAASLTTQELETHALSSDRSWITELIQIANSAESDDLIDACLAAPARAMAGGAPSVIIIDGLFDSMFLEGGENLVSSLFEAASASPAAFVIAGPRRLLFGKTSFGVVKVDRLSTADASGMVDTMATALGVHVNNETSDLVALQVGENAQHICSVITSAAEDARSLNSFAAFQKVYTDELFGGRISRYFDDLFHKLLPLSDRDALVRVLTDLSQPGHVASMSSWQSELGPAADRVVNALHRAELINSADGSIAINSDNVFIDYVHASAALAARSRTRAAIVGTTVVANVERAPELMASMYRRQAALGLRQLLELLQGQSVAAAALDYSRFKTQLKGLPDQDILAELRRERDRVALPRIHFSAYTADLYPPFGTLCERQQSAAGLAAKETWMAVEIESKLEASREAAEFWCDRLEMAAAANDFESIRLWLIAPEGFQDDAMAALEARGAIGSSRKQVELLRQLVASALVDQGVGALEEFDLIVPMGEESEIISARTVEEIGRRYDIPQRTLNQIKTALVEACINAAEHSLSPDRKLYQKFAIGDGKLTITISNRGVRLSDRKLRVVSPNEGRRGWGLKLMRGLMDDVTIEETDDGTRITMTKFLDIKPHIQTAAS